jgi:UDP-3-O-[3-hydroxymyristoyl] glucosamine N-acyltransferase
VFVEKSVTEIARFLGGQVIGDGEIRIVGVASITEARPGEIAFLDSMKYESLLESTRASAVIVAPQTQRRKQTLISVSQPRLAFAQVMRLFYPCIPDVPRGIHPTAVIGDHVRLGENVHIGAYVCIADGAEIGGGAILFPSVFVGAKTCVGSGSVIYPNVTLRERVTIGANVIIHSGSVIGSDGFGYAQEEDRHLKIPQVGTVVVEDDVEIGANVAIDRGTLGATRIGRGTKIDNLVQIAHNVTIGPNSILSGQVGIAGSTEIGAGAILAGQVGVVGHITIGEGSIIGAKSGVSKSVPPHSMVFGSPARPINKTKRIEACLSRLPELFKRVHKLESEFTPPERDGE